MTKQTHAERLRLLATDRASDGPSATLYDPELLDALSAAADYIDRLLEVVAAARAVRQLADREYNAAYDLANDVRAELDPALATLEKQP